MLMRTTIAKLNLVNCKVYIDYERFLQAEDEWSEVLKISLANSIQQSARFEYIDDCTRKEYHIQIQNPNSALGIYVNDKRNEVR